MKCFLVNPDYPKKHRLLFPVPPLGLAYVAAVMEKHGCQVKVEDQFASGIPDSDLVDAIMDFGPDILGLGSLTPSIGTAAGLAAQVRERGFTGLILMGNVHPSVFARELLEEGVCDIVVRGESEAALEHLLRVLDENAPLEDVDGVSFRAASGEVRSNPPRAQIRDLDSLPLPAWHLFNLDHYRNAPLLQVYGLALPIQGSRGCPERCLFCGQEIFFSKLAKRSVDSLMAEIDWLVDRFGIEYFVFVDANFPMGKKHGLEFCRRFSQSRHHNKVFWCCELKVDMVDLELLQAMKAAGCTTVEYGFESGDERILSSLNKHTTLEQGRRAMELTRQAGLQTLGLFMIGLPGEGVREIFKTFTFARSIGCDMAKFNITIPLPGSQLFDRHRRELLRNFHPETYSSWYRPGKGDPPLTTTPGAMKPGALILLQTLGMLMFYCRPSLVLRHLKRRSLRLPDMARGVGFLFSELLGGVRLR